MTNSEFRHWLAGYLELSLLPEFTPKTLWIIKNHLNLVFAVESHFDADLQWLDQAILALKNGREIKLPSEELINAIKHRFNAPIAK